MKSFSIFFLFTFIVNTFGQSTLIKDSTIYLENLIFSPTKFKKNALSTASNVAVIDLEKNVILQNPQTAADLLGSSGNVFIQKSQQGGGSPMIRGFATNRLLYSVDGVRMNNAIFRGGNIQNVISLDPLAIEKTEIFLGAGSVIYGSDAIGGVMSFKTLSPNFSKSTNFNLSGNTFGRYATANNETTGHIDLNFGWTKLALLSSFTFTNYDDLKMGSHGPDEYLKPSFVDRVNNQDIEVTNSNPKVQIPSGYSQINLMQKIRYQPHKDLDLEYGFHYSETSDYGRYDRHLRERNGNPRYGEWSYGPQKWIFNHLSVNYKDPNFFFDRMSIDAAHQFFEESRITRNFNALERTTRTEKVNAYSLNVDFLKNLNSKNQLQYGFEEIFNDVNSEGILENISTYEESQTSSRYPKSIWNSFGFYVFNSYQPNRRFSLDFGFRYNYYYLHSEFNSTFFSFPFSEATLNDSSLSGEIGLVYQTKNNWILKTKLSSAFRTPNIDDVGKVFDSEPGAVVVPNPYLDEEQSYNIEGTVEKRVANKLNVGITGFFTYLDNAMVRRNFTFNGQDSIVYDGVLSQVQAIQNAARTKIYGFQTSIDWYFSKSLKFKSQLNFQQGTEELEDGSTSPARHAAPMFGVSRLIYANNRLNLELNAFYSDHVKYEDLSVEERTKTEIYAIDENGNPWSPSWYIINLKGKYNLTNQLTVSSGIENITDQRYRPYSSGIAAAGRNLIISLRMKF